MVKMKPPKNPLRYDLSSFHLVTQRGQSGAHFIHVLSPPRITL